MDVFILAGQSNMAGRGDVYRSEDGQQYFRSMSNPLPAAVTGHQDLQIDAAYAICTCPMSPSRTILPAVEAVRQSRGMFDATFGNIGSLLSFSTADGWHPAIEPIHQAVDSR